MRRRALCVIMVVAALSAACSAPPSKEMGQAQGAIDAARAAGAEQYATDELKAAVDGLARSQEAVNQRDYRLALNYALESRERGQNAAKLAADQKAIVRSEAEKVLNEAALALVQANTRLRQMEASKPLRKQLVAPRETIDAAESAVQKARASLEGGSYLEARSALRGALDQIRGAMRQMDALAAPPPPPRKRR
jgi:uncharacterized protein DUF4398